MLLRGGAAVQCRKSKRTASKCKLQAETPSPTPFLPLSSVSLHRALALAPRFCLLSISPHARNPISSRGRARTAAAPPRPEFIVLLNVYYRLQKQMAFLGRRTRFGGEGGGGGGGRRGRSRSLSCCRRRRRQQ